MIKGIGTDIIEIERVKHAMEQAGFLERCFSPDELQMLEQKRFAPQSVAAGFAAKEAVSKALGTGISGLKLCDIEVLRDERGKPHIILRGGAKRIAEELGITEVLITLSHNKTSAVAFAVAQ